MCGFGRGLGPELPPPCPVPSKKKKKKGEDEEKPGFGLGRDHVNIFRHTRIPALDKPEGNVRTERKLAAVVIRGVLPLWGCTVASRVRLRSLAARHFRFGS